MENARVENLNDVKVGDIFYISGYGRSTYEKVTCKSVSLKQAVIGDMKYKKEGARPLGRQQRYNFRSYTLYHPTEELLRRVELFNARHKLSSIKWDDVSDDKILAIIKILEPKQEIL